MGWGEERRLREERKCVHCVGCRKKKRVETRNERKRRANRRVE